ncbi:uncharacterized protein B0H18DRAFT_1129098 [Fomitopsis serialis]|uniref:uncharacterized protein n=1 Tax=Fomitopsis serialis TaxID=139415 RepID=UPI0020078203|nr:uncharacterized protein B0H18DRAFT_1129098 [Neoantrodia serialis]KAH9911111.1 hypothetical protein B0H18DRAFT_1129098 [Neoantrodia serialis]
MVTVSQVHNQYCSYLEALYLYFLSVPASRPGAAPLPGLLLDVYLVRQARRAAQMLADAYRNRRTVQWDASTHPCTVPDDDELAAVQYEDCQDPLTIADNQGRVLMWHLPGVITEVFQVRQNTYVHRQLSMTEYKRAIWHATIGLNPLLSHNRPKASASWRENIENFREPQEGDDLKPACVAFSPGWFWLGHAGANDVPLVSRLLTDPNTGPAGHMWLDQMAHPHIIISGMLRIMHPDLYDAGRASIEALRSDPDRASIVDLWHNPFNALSVITNRASPVHRDMLSPKEWYDILMTIGGDPSSTSSFRLWVSDFLTKPERSPHSRALASPTMFHRRRRSGYVWHTLCDAMYIAGWDAGPGYVLGWGGNGFSRLGTRSV